ncbi:hypothetical protein [Nocardia grenadensis]|uniref:hypothetical protein n=1 Tax=Nocardia grenadensis TaxID=931537 RepID=UPI003D734528
MEVVDSTPNPTVAGRTHWLRVPPTTAPPARVWRGHSAYGRRTTNRSCRPDRPDLEQSPP